MEEKMAINPIERRTRNSLITGLLIGGVIAIIVGAISFMQITKLNGEIKKEKGKIKQVYVAARDIKANNEVKPEDLTMEGVVTSLQTDKIVTPDSLTATAGGSVASLLEKQGDKLVANAGKKEFASTITPGGDSSSSSSTNSSSSSSLNSSSSSSESKADKIIIATIDIPKGTIITEKMLTLKSEAATDSNNMNSTYRIVEYSMIMLPTELQKGDTIDIRISYPNGQDFVVAAKKVVEKTDSTSIWLKLKEDELLKMNSAIIESYSVEGAKLYAVNYTQPGIQAAANANYPVSDKVYQLLTYDPNIVEAIQQQYKNAVNNYLVVRKPINEILQSTQQEELRSRISSAVQKEIRERTEKRQTFIEGAAK
jgi:SAF domain protein